jgi:outer membrane protein
MSPRMGWPVSLAVAVGVMTVAVPASAQQGEWRVGGRLLSVNTDANTEPLTVSESRIVFDSSWTAEFDATYMVGNYWGLEWMVTTAPHDLAAVEGTLDGLDVGEVWVAETTLTLQYHIPVWGKWRPYAGLGIGGAYLHSSKTTDEARAADIRKVESDFMSGGVAQVGVAYRHGNRWLFSFDIKYGAFSGDVKVKDSDGTTTDKLETDLDPWLIGLGAAFRF